MKAIRLHAIRDLRVDEVDAPPAPGPGEVLVRVAAVGLCGSDLHYYRNFCIGDQVVRPPMILGHEFCGTVAAVGEGVTNVAVGRRVAVEPGVPCGRCEPCRRGRENVCANMRFAGAAPRNGAGCEYWLHPARLVFPLPDTLSDAEGTLLEPLGVALHAVKLSGIAPGQSTAVMGAGPIGLCLLAALKAMGAGPVYVSEPLPDRREQARRSGADAVLDPGDEGAGRQILERTGGRGVEVTFEAAGTPEAMNDAIRAAERCGKACLVGICEQDLVPLSLHEARRRELVIFNSRRAHNVNEQAIELMASGQVDLKPLITHHFALDRAPEAFARAERREEGLLKAVIHLT